jgi:hypothetical protein
MILKKLYQKGSETPNSPKHGAAYKMLQKITNFLAPIRALKVLCLLLLFSTFISCYDEVTEVWNTYTIEKGDHYSKGRFPGTIHGNRVRFDAVFSSGTLQSNVSGDLNKLYGFIDANSSVHRNSARFAWVSDGARINVYSYLYRDGVRTFKKIGEVLPEERHSYEIIAKDKRYTFKLDTVTHTFNRFHHAERGARFRLFPYFGGDLPAPNTMQIRIYQKD